MNEFPHIPIDYGVFQIVKAFDYSDVDKGLSNVDMFAVIPFVTNEKECYNYRILFRSFIVNKNKRNMIVLDTKPIVVKEFYISDYIDEVATNISNSNKEFEKYVINQCKMIVKTKEVEKIVRECHFDLFVKATTSKNLSKIITGNYLMVG